LADAGFGVVHHFEEAGAGEGVTLGRGLEFDTPGARQCFPYEPPAAQELDRWTRNVRLAGAWRLITTGSARTARWVI